MARNVYPTIALLNELGKLGAHRPNCHQTSKSPRLMRAICRTCGYVGTEGKGSVAYQEMLEHAISTLPARFRVEIPDGNWHKARLVSVHQTEIGQELDEQAEVGRKEKYSDLLADAVGTLLAGKATRVSVGLQQSKAELEADEPASTQLDAQRDGFHAAYRKLEDRMKALAETDGDVFMPNPEPPGPVDYVFICMEPSFFGWASSREDAERKVNAGFRDIHPFALHFCIRQYLRGPRQRYYITDFSKGAMPVKRAGLNRAQRYGRWYSLLLDELGLVAKPDARVFAVGKVVERQLMERSFPWPFTTLLHHSEQAAMFRRTAIVGREAEFEQFRGSVSAEALLATAKDVLAEYVPATFHQKILSRFVPSQLSESLQLLIFNYKLAFEARGAARLRSAVR
jgi:hypothetical protein